MTKIKQSQQIKFNKFNNTSGLVKKLDYNAKITETPSASGLATNVALTAVQNKIPKISSLVKETDYNLKTIETEKKLTDHNHDKYITTSEFNKLTVGVLHARLARPNLVTKVDFDDKRRILNQESNLNETKHFLVEDELKKVQTFD